MVENPLIGILCLAGILGYMNDADEDSSVGYKQEINELAVNNNARLATDILYNMDLMSNAYPAKTSDQASSIDFSADNAFAQLQRVFTDTPRLLTYPEVEWGFVGKSAVTIKSVERRPINKELCEMINLKASTLTNATFGCVQSPDDKETYIWNVLNSQR
jgi:hypothetical protein